MDGHHLILGELIDFITGETLPDTHDERFRQKIARLLVEQKGYAKDQVIARHPLTVRADKKCATIPISYMIKCQDRLAMIIQYGPGSLVTRHRPALAMGRLAAAYQIPFVVVTNGEQADILNGATGKVMAQGLDQIPSGNQLPDTLDKAAWKPIDPHHAELEARIVIAFEVDDRCPCDTTICTLKEGI